MNITQAIIISFYATIILYFGIYSGSTTNRRETFLISDRSLLGTSNGYSIAASKIGGGLLVTYSTIFFVYGLQALWVFIGYVIGYFVFYIFARKIHQESKECRYYSMADYFQHHYGKKVGIAISVLSILSVGGWILTNLIAGGMLLSIISGWPTLFTTSFLALIIALYLIKGGFNAVVKTDIIQFYSLIIIGSIIAVALYHVDGNLPQANVSIWGSESLPIGKVIFFIFIGLLFPMGSVELWQRVYAANSTLDYFKATTIASVSFFVFGGILSFICYKLMLMQNLQNIDPELRLVAGVAEIMNGIHPALTALWFLVFFAAILSSADTFMYTTAASLVQDLFLRMGWIKETAVVKWIRISIIMLAIIGTAGSVIFKDIVSVTFYFLGLTLILSTIAYGVWIAKLTTWALLLPMGTGLVASTYSAIFQGISITTSMIALVTTASTLILQLIGSHIVKYFAKK